MFRLNDPIQFAQWAADECDRQLVGPLRVPDMMRATRQAATKGFFTVTCIQKLGHLVEPDRNPVALANGENHSQNWRWQEVTIGGVIPLMPSDHVPGAMARLISLSQGLDRGQVDLWYKQFEEIHPFVDGNGRVGSILWNSLNGNLEEGVLEAPPDFWSESNKQRIVNGY